MDKRLENLEWCTHKENIQHAIKFNLTPQLFKTGHTRNVGERHYNAKLTKNRVLEIRKLLERGVSQSKIGEEYGVSQSCISNIKLNKRWASEYN